MPPPATRDTFWRTLLTFGVTRIVIAIVLFVYLIFNTKRAAGTVDQLIYWQTCVAYLALAIGFALLAVRYRRHFFLQLWLQITVDIVVISTLYAEAGGTKTGLAILYLFPLAGGAILAPMLPALFFASVVTLFLLAQSGYQSLALAEEATFSQAGLYCAAFFAAVFVINRLAAKLIKQEELATRRGIDLQLQEAINRLVIADMGDGILVVGRHGEILTANPAAERMLGLSIPYDKPYYRLAGIPFLAPIADAFFAWQAWPSDNAAEQTGASTFVVVKPGGDDMLLQGTAMVSSGRRELAAHLKLRFAKVDAADLIEDRTVIFLQDVTEIGNQAQQLKLASMGRLTASIAHEVRNPLSAISYASSLLSEETTDPAQTRLLNIVSDNVARLNRMIEDILKLSRKAQPHNEPLALSPFFTEILGEFRETHGIPADMVELGEMTRYRIWFDPLHLREVVMNLLTNAVRYASGKSGSIRIYALPEAHRLELHVQDDGPPITPEVRAHLFEPFYTTSSKGTGLGLYLARELCLNNGAMIDYEYRVDVSDDRLGQTSGRFVMTFALADPIEYQSEPIRSYDGLGLA